MKMVRTTIAKKGEIGDVQPDFRGQIKAQTKMHTQVREKVVQYINSISNIKVKRHVNL